MWQPVINGYDDTEFWNDEGNNVWLKNSENLTLTTYPAPTDAVAASVFSNQLCVKAMQQILVNGVEPQEALDSLEQSLLELYGE